MPGEDLINFEEEVAALFPDFEWFWEEQTVDETIVDEETQPESTLLSSINEIIPQIQNASAEERLQAARMILG